MAWKLRAQATIHELAINPVVYAELSLSFTIREALDSAVQTMQLSLREIVPPGPVPGRQGLRQLPPSWRQQDAGAAGLRFRSGSCGKSLNVRGRSAR
jgi:hypothetical protein